MALEIECYFADKALSTPFSSASGTLSKKTFIQLLFKEDEAYQFIYELPLSPSLGEMPIDLLQAFEGKDNAFSGPTIPSPIIQNALSYYLYFQTHRLTPVTAQEKFKIVTVGIDQEYQTTNESVVHRFKGAKKNLGHLIHLSQELGNPWIVDFNQSLDQEDLIYFISRANLKHCLYIEQPLKAGTASAELLKSLASPIFADEEVPFIEWQIFHQSGYAGVVLKPLRLNAERLFEWLRFCDQQSVPALIGGMFSDSIALEFNRFLNQFTSWQLDYSANPIIADLLNPLLPPYPLFFLENQKLVVNPDVFSLVKTNYDYRFSISLNS